MATRSTLLQQQPDILIFAVMVSLRFIHRDNLESEGYGRYLSLFTSAGPARREGEIVSEHQSWHPTTRWRFPAGGDLSGMRDGNCCIATSFVAA
ncbi:hypothetical protein [Mycobacterium sp. 852002-40037_SCH5390672]|uniref:hypothetical protein n=1 Tax=Mycobacterium sp. 852002-40037_SCH5390672 TaxID=1834089 RepID=UPI00080545C8|nr:hypothetical protein [Mycobacterium sp. 852002-40037_SCH5390672]OBB98192.1 hypothetical protein A5782_24900 [Mycobacterium sp. 852002-40037_SCH5390672]